LPITASLSAPLEALWLTHEYEKPQRTQKPKSVYFQLKINQVYQILMFLEISSVSEFTVLENLNFIIKKSRTPRVELDDTRCSRAAIGSEQSFPFRSGFSRQKQDDALLALNKLGYFVSVLTAISDGIDEKTDRYTIYRYQFLDGNDRLCSG
jgi:hypothetical protein